MRHALLTVLSASGLLAQAPATPRVAEADVESLGVPTATRDRVEIGRELAAALDGGTRADDDAPLRRDPPASAAGLQVLRTAAASAATALPQTSLVAGALRQAIAPAAAGDAEASAHTRRVHATLMEIADDLRFVPLREAPTPADWPAPAPVGDVVIKAYPAYRMATAPMRNQGDMSAFGKLFRHIQTNDIPMTAPVQMDHAAAPERETGARRAMAFLYEDDARGQVGKAGDVEIVDVPAATWASIGARGYETRDSIDDLRTTLQAWVREHAPRYEIAGPMRVMGWNSPSVRGDRRFYEVELPLRLRRDV